MKHTFMLVMLALMFIICSCSSQGTMEEADVLYGVTMPQKGISKVLTMDVNDVGKDRILSANNNAK